jgi:hypothetical protein
MLFYSLSSFLSAGILGGSTAKNKKKHLCVLCVSAVKTICYHECTNLTNRTGRKVLTERSENATDQRKETK